MKEPRRAKPQLPPSEDPDRHKFIHDGTEYARPPNLFDVGGGELKLLPEVLSDLNFEARDFVDGGTPAEQKELRDSRPWGRLHVDGWPAPMQYLRSHFGGPPVEGMRSLVLASPLNACEPLRKVDSGAGTPAVLDVTVVAVAPLCYMCINSTRTQFPMLRKASLLYGIRTVLILCVRYPLRSRLV